MASRRIARPKSRRMLKEVPISSGDRTMLGLRVEAAARRIGELRRHVLPAGIGQGPEAREAQVKAGCDVLATVERELEAAAMEIFGPYNAGVSRLGAAAAAQAKAVA